MKKWIILIILPLIGIVSLFAKDISEVTPIDASQRNQIVVSGGGGGAAAGGPSLTANNTWTSPTNLFFGRIQIGTNSLPNATQNQRAIFLVYSNSAMQNAFVNEGQICGFVIGHRDTTAGAIANLYVSANRFELDCTTGSGNVGGIFRGNVADPIAWDANGTNILFGDGQTMTRFNLNGAKLKVNGAQTFDGNVTNMVGTGLSNVVCYSSGIVTNRFTIP